MSANIDFPKPARVPITVSKKGLRFVLFTIGSTVFFVLFFGLLGFRINLTPSYPLGIWRVVHGVPKKGDLVMFNFPSNNALVSVAYERGYLKQGSNGFMPLMKRLAAVNGDRVSVTDRITINDTPWANGEILNTDSKGRGVIGIAASETVQPGMCWVLSDYNPRSFDSRYFGPVPVDAITSIMKPVFTIKTEF